MPSGMSGIFQTTRASEEAVQSFKDKSMNVVSGSGSPLITSGIINSSYLYYMLVCTPNYL